MEEVVPTSPNVVEVDPAQVQPHIGGGGPDETMHCFELPKKVKTKYALSLASLFSVGLTVAILGLLWYFLIRDGLKDLAHDAVNEIILLEKGGINLLYMNSTLALRTAQNLALYGNLHLDDWTSASVFFAMLVESSTCNPHGVYYGRDSDGYFVYGYDMEDCTRLGAGLRDEVATGGLLNSFEIDENYIVNTTAIDEGAVYDPRARPWYTGVVDRLSEFQDGSLPYVWTEPYEYIDGQLGMTVSAPLLDEDGSLLGVFGSDITLTQISEFLEEKKVADTQVSVVIDRLGYFIASSTPDQPVTLCVQVDGCECGYVLSSRRCEYRRVLETERYSGAVADVLGLVDDKEGLPSTLTSDFQLFGRDRLVHGAMENMFEDWVLVVSVEYEEFTEELDDGVVKVSIASVCVSFVTLCMSFLGANRLTRPLNMVRKSMAKVAQFELGDYNCKKSKISEMKKLEKSMSNLHSALSAFQRYVPADLVRTLVKNNVEANLGMEEGEITVFFSDIESFTTISELLTLNQLVELLGEFFEEWTNILLQNHGTVDKFIGDAIMAFWNAPLPCPGHQKVACGTALKMQERLAILRQKWLARGYPEIRARIGLHCGKVLVGNMGSSDRLNYTVIGDTVNLASRLEGANKRYGTYIMISDAMEEKAASSFLCRPLDIVKVKGRGANTTVYELVGFMERANSSDVEFAKQTRKAFSSFQQREFALAVEEFTQAGAMRPEDKSVRYLLDRAVEYAAVPPPDDADLG
eukprot:Rmarinus@m.19231